MQIIGKKSLFVLTFRNDAQCVFLFAILLAGGCGETVSAKRFREANAKLDTLTFEFDKLWRKFNRASLNNDYEEFSKLFREMEIIDKGMNKLQEVTAANTPINKAPAASVFIAAKSECGDIEKELAKLGKQIQQSIAGIDEKSLSNLEDRRLALVIRQRKAEERRNRNRPSFAK